MSGGSDSSSDNRGNIHHSLRAENVSGALPGLLYILVSVYTIVLHNRNY